MKFMEAVGWRSGDDFVRYSSVIFSSTLSPVGQLPFGLFGVDADGDWGSINLFSRSDL